MSKQRVARHEVIQPLDPSYRLIPLTQGQNVKVDVCDYEWLNQWMWLARWSKITRSFYVVRRDYSGTQPKTVYMSRIIMNCDGKDHVDHRNHDTLDNRRSNLRKCRPSENHQNRRKLKSGTSKYKGVCWRKDRSKWLAEIRYRGRLTKIGLFSSEVEAAKAYDRVAIEKFGEFAHLNFPTVSAVKEEE